jgi:tungstate transport system substrate-binding protein
MKGKVFRSACALAILLSACRTEAPHRTVDIATTTSLQGSGLLGVLTKSFKADQGIELRAFVVGSGQALNLAKRGMVDLVITHDPANERAFVLSERPEVYKQFMWNDFVIVGPPTDPARIRRSRTAQEAFRRMFDARARFCSRNDLSGTHARELSLWAAAGVDPDRNPNYLKLGQPMAHLLRSADELQACTLSDRATFDQLSTTLQLAVLFEGDRILRNVYTVILMPRRDARDAAEHRNAKLLAQWLLSAKGRAVIANYRIAGRAEFYVLP